MQVFDDQNVALDATATLHPGASGFEVLIASRSGSSTGPSARNPHYERLVETVLRRAATLDATLASVRVESDDTVHLADAERSLDPDGALLPARLSSVTDFRDFRVNLWRPMGGIGRRPGARGPGNRNKKARMVFMLPEAFSADRVELALARPASAVGLTAPEVRSAFSQLADATGGARAWDLKRLQAILDRCATSAPEVRERASRYIERGPVGDIVKQLSERRCQICMACGLDGRGFKTRRGVDYVEAHHVVLVSTGGVGVLRPENVVAVCPNHHRELHYGRVQVTDVGDAFVFEVELGRATVQKAREMLEALRDLQREGQQVAGSGPGGPSDPAAASSRSAP
ncbi:MAG: HNH endonuclease signature motif containing protein [Phenylobacterium sp.]